MDDEFDMVTRIVKFGKNPERRCIPISAEVIKEFGGMEEFDEIFEKKDMIVTIELVKKKNKQN